MGAGRSREGDRGRLPREHRSARRPDDRPLPDPRARSADAMADVCAGARAARRRWAGAPRRRRERHPHPARRSARAGADRGGADRSEPVRRPRPSRRRGRALRRARVAADRPLTARRSAPGRHPGSPPGARGDRRPSRRHPRRDGARLAARHFTRAHRDPGSPAAGDRTVGSAGGRAPPRCRRPGVSDGGVRRCRKPYARRRPAPEARW